MKTSTHATQLLKYLSAGVQPVEAARALGVTPSAVTQLMQSEELAPEVEKIRAAQAERGQALDQKYDALEEKLLNKLEQTIPLLMKPMEITKVLSHVNAAKRRGIVATTSTETPQIVHLHLPPQIRQRVILNAQNQVVAVGDKQLITIQSANVAKLAEANHAKPLTITDENEDKFGFSAEG